jgi:hypothetical protein
MEFKIHRNFITEEERLHLKHYADTHFQGGRFWPNHVYSKRWILVLKRSPQTDHNGAYYTNEIHNLYMRILSTLDIPDGNIDPRLGILISYIEPGGFIHKHRDIYSSPDWKDKFNYRFNIVVDRGSDPSYNPVIEDISYDIGKGDAWSFNATTDLHYTLPIAGPENRIVYQFGFAISKEM